MGPTEATDGSIEHFVFRRIVPEGALGRLVESVWYARGVVPYEQEQVAPTGATVAAVVLGDPIRQRAANGKGEEFLATTGFLVGPHDEPMINAPTGETHAVGIVTTPIGCQPVLGVPPGDLAGRVVDLEAWWPPATELRRRLITGVEDGREHERLLAETATFLEDHLVSAGPGLDRIEQAVAMVEADPAEPISKVAEAVGLSHGHLDEEFARLVGLSPRVLSRLLRVRRVLEELNGSTGAVVWSDLAVRHGWYDQAHMNRDFKRHTGVSPTVYVARRQQAFTGVDPQPGFVPSHRLRRPRRPPAADVSGAWT